MTTRWGARAAALYNEAYARRYRHHDDAIRDGALVQHFGTWLRATCDLFEHSIDVLDLGCGTGRYFHALHGVRRLVGIDISRAMLDQAKHPIGDLATAEGSHASVTLIEGDFLQHEFGAGEFDLVYSVGVLAEHSPFDEEVAGRVRRWLRTGGRFAFTAVHPLSFSVPRTLKRRIGEWVLPVLSRSLRNALRAQLMSEGLYADEERVRDVFSSTGLIVESMERYESDVHSHVLTVARRQP